MKKRRIIVLLIVTTLIMATVVIGGCSGQGTGKRAIKTQPQSVVVEYPKGTEFSVKVNKPELVKSYQWMMRDIAGNEFLLTGVTATTDTLIIPSSQRSNRELEFYCVITDQEGNEITSEVATMENGNDEEYKPVLYVGEYAIEPGEEIDLGGTDIGDGQKLGQGKVTFDANGKDIIFDNVAYDNTNMTADYLCAPNVGISLVYDYPETEEYNITFIGDNSIYNAYYDEEYNAGGIPFDFYFSGEGEKPLVSLIGDGTLTVTNGSIAIRAISDLMIDIDVTVAQDDDRRYGDGIFAQHMMVGEGRKLNLEVLGTALSAEGNLYLKNAEVKIDANAPHISMGMAAKSIIDVEYDFMIDNSKIDIMAHANPEICSSVGMLTAINVYGILEAYDSDYSFEIDVIGKDELYVSNVSAVIANDIAFDGCNVDIKIDSNEIFSASGMYSEGNVLIANSEATIDIKACGEVYGVAPEMDFSVEESNVKISVANHKNYEHLGSFGVLCENLVMKLTEADKKVEVYSEDGIAIGCNTGELGDGPADYIEGYEAKNVYLREGTICSLPLEHEISLGSKSTQDGYEHIYLETYYDMNDVTEPAREVHFKAGE